MHQPLPLTFQAALGSSRLCIGTVLYRETNQGVSWAAESCCMPESMSASQVSGKNLCVTFEFVGKNSIQNGCFCLTSELTPKFYLLIWNQSPLPSNAMLRTVNIFINILRFFVTSGFIRSVVVVVEMGRLHVWGLDGLCAGKTCSFVTVLS